MKKTKNIYTFDIRSWTAVTIASIVSLVGFLWPFFIDSTSEHRSQIEAIFFYLAVPVALTLLMTELSNSRLDAKSVALLGVLTAVTAALRPIGAGAIGIEPMWFILILSARVFGPAFGFILGILSIFLSACFTGGFGPWLSYQMFAAGWIGLAAGLRLPHRLGKKKIRGKFEVALLVAFSILASLGFGLLMDLQFWPWAVGSNSQLSYHAGAGVLTNAQKFIAFHFASSMAWDIPRAIFTSLLVITTAPAVLFSLRRSKKRAAFLTPIEFLAAKSGVTEHAKEQMEV